MFRTHTSVPSSISPVHPDWTINDVMAWVADDDARCHDEALRPVLSALAGLRQPQPGVRPSSTVALVRQVAAHLRREPASGDIRVRDLLGRGVR